MNAAITRWVATGICGAALTAGWGYAAGQLAAGNRFSWLHAIVYAICAAPPLFAFSWLMLVTPVAPPSGPARPEETVERAWLRRAAEGAFFDLMAVLGILLAVTTVADPDVRPALIALLLLLCGALDVAVRYRVLSRREA